MKFKNVITKTGALILAGGIITGLAGCAAGEGESTATEETTTSTATQTSTEVASSQSEKTGTKTITDHDGHVIELPEKIDRIVISSILPLPSVYCLFDGSAQKLVGMHPSSMAAAKNSMLAKVFPEVTEVSTDFVQGGTINAEELIKLEPDVVFYAAGDEEEYKLITDAGLTAVGFSAQKFGYDSVQTFEEWVKLLGEIFDEEDKAAGIADYGHEVYEEIQTKLEAAGEELEEPDAMILFNYGSGTTTVSGSNFFGQYWLESTGAKNVASELTGRPEVNMEQIYEWDPDIIYITNFSPALPEDLYNNAIGEDDWSHVSAVTNKQVYKFPLGMYRWFPPASDTPLVLKWLAKTNQPEIFADVDMEQEVKDYYKRFYDVELTDEDIESIFNPSREASGQTLQN